MSHPNRPVAAGVSDRIPLPFVEKPDYDEAFGPQNKVYRESIVGEWRTLWSSPLTN